MWFFKKINMRCLRSLFDDRVGAYAVIALVAAQGLLVLASWLLPAAMPEVFAKSLLSAEGIRWFMGRFAQNLSSVWLVWLLLISIAYGAVRGCGLLCYDRSFYRQRLGMRLALVELIVFIVVLLALTVAPHAILLNVMGDLLPSTFTQSLVPYLCFMLVVMSVSFGVMSERINSLAGIYRLLTDGIRSAAPLYLYYLLIMQLCHSIKYLFG